MTNTKLYRRRRIQKMGRYQIKIALSYLAVIAVILILLNTYPVFVSQSLVFQYKRSTMNSHAYMMTSTLSGFEHLPADRISNIMKAVDDRSTYRVIVCNDEGLIIYDNSELDSSVGKTALFFEIATALTGSDAFFSRFEGESFESRLGIPIMSKGTVTGALYLYELDLTQATLLSDLQSNLSTFSIIISILIVLLSIVISLALTQRVSGLLWAIRAVREGDYGRKAPIKGHDELSEVAGQFNELTEILYKTENLRRQFVSDASHELKTPLASIRLLTDSILQTNDMSEETIREFVSDIGDEIDRLTRMTEKLIQLSRLESVANTEQSRLDVADTIRRAAHLLEPFANKNQVELVCELEEECWILGDSDDLYLVVYNLMENGVKYNKVGGRVRVQCYQSDVEVFINVDDTGMGIPKKDLENVFDRFYRVDKTRSRAAGGTGLGLAIVKETLERLDGSIKLDSIVGKGTRFTLAFPKSEQGEGL